MHNQITITKIIPKNIVPQLKFSVFKIGLVNKKVANKAISIMRQLQALKPGLSYLKRVRNMSEQINGIQCVQILLCQQSQHALFEKIFQRFQAQIKQDIMKIIEVQIPKYSPINKQQFLQWSKFWPINFIEPTASKEIIHNQQELFFLSKLIELQKDIILFSDKILFQYQINEKQGRHSCNECSYPPYHPIMQIAQYWPKTQEFLKQQQQISKQSYYYFTKLRIMIKNTKLCEMCAMGLVHSRLQRLYFYNCFPSQQVQNILFCQKLNHKVEMFQIKYKQK